ncbi:MAG: C40 family peptidase [Crocinitomicaceae bacterium]|nr:C40 family peptidase [Crocinitomicaceae bacterium]
MLTVGDFGICNVSVAPVRASASDAAEMVTQLLFGDYVKIIEKGEPWIKIRFERDDYEGYMDFKQLTYIDRQLYDAGTAVRHKVLFEPILELEGPRGIQNIMMGSDLPFYKDGKVRLGHELYTVLAPVDMQFKADILETAEIYLNSPYLWGGKSIFGIDCSGLVQLVFKVCGADLPRDASKQVHTGSTVRFDQRQSGDLAFFINDAGRVHHVGIVASPHEIIHAAGRVRKDRLDEEGIFNFDLEKKTHTLHVIKRISL